jgi:hypothetical protein
VNEARRIFSRHPFCREVLPFSSVTGEGKNEVMGVLAEHLKIDGILEAGRV